MNERKNHCIELLKNRGVTLLDISECVKYLLGKSVSSYSDEMIFDSIEAVLGKREIQFALMSGIALDLAAENHTLEDKDLEKALLKDEPLFGIDETLAFGMCNVYGSIALSNFGYIDKHKYGIIAKLNDDGKSGVRCNTFIDDIVGAISACAAARLFHQGDEL